MLRRLHIQDVILVEEASLEIQEGFNVLTGETGAGKSALMAAIGAVLGQRASTDLVRKGAKKAVIEAAFDADKIEDLLSESGIDQIRGEELIIRREIAASGKSRAFINNQMAQLSLLQKLGRSLVERIGQRAKEGLLDPDHHRWIVDTFGDLTSEREAFSKAFEKEKGIQSELKRLHLEESTRLREIDRLKRELQELDDAEIKRDEEASLFTEYTLHVNSEELIKSLKEVLELLSDGGALGALFRTQPKLHRISELNPKCQDAEKNFSSALIELQEVELELTRRRDELDFNPQRLQEVNERLSLINHLKRKYGASFEEMNAYHRQIRENLSSLEHADERIEELEKGLKDAKSKTDALANKLSTKRQAAAKVLEKKLEKALRGLNMSQTTFHIQVDKAPRSISGDDTVEFFFAPNVGEKKVAVRQSASGGELSRIMLAIKVLLADKEDTPTLLFDEIDANIGGETATIVGQHLAKLGVKHQLLCITHFPQVARQAHHHILVDKTEINRRTLTQVHTLSQKDREAEWSRMAGEKVPALT